MQGLGCARHYIVAKRGSCAHIFENPCRLVAKEFQGYRKPSPINSIQSDLWPTAAAEMSGKAVLAVIRASHPELRSRADKLAFALHASVMVNGYLLVGVGELCNDDAPDSLSPEASIVGWNSQGEAYCFKYLPEDRKGSGLLYKALNLDNTLLASFLHLSEGASPVTIELDVTKYTTDADELSAAFTNLDDLASRVESVLVPKDTTAPPPLQQAASTSAVTSSQRRPPDDESLQDPDFRPTHPMYGQDPLMVGGNDLDPLGLGRPGRRDPFPGGGLPDPIMGGGMHVGPDHPYFRDHLRNPQIRPGMTPPGVPPGARWDPIRPPGMPGFNPEDFQRGPNRGVHPDIGPPPGQGTNWDSMFG